MCGNSEVRGESINLGHALQMPIGIAKQLTNYQKAFDVVSDAALIRHAHGAVQLDDR